MFNRQTTSWARSYSTLVTNFSTPPVDPGVLIDSPVNDTLHCPAFTLSKWISITYLHSALSVSNKRQSQMTHGNVCCSFDFYFYYPPGYPSLFFSPLLLISCSEYTIVFSFLKPLTWLFFYSRRKVNRISATLVAWWSVGFSRKLWTRSDLLCFLVCCLLQHSWYLF